MHEIDGVQLGVDLSLLNAPCMGGSRGLNPAERNKTEAVSDYYMGYRCLWVL